MAGGENMVSNSKNGGRLLAGTLISSGGYTPPPRGGSGRNSDRGAIVTFAMPDENRIVSVRSAIPSASKPMTSPKPWRGCTIHSPSWTSRGFSSGSAPMVAK